MLNNTFLTGGAVRDIFLGKQPKDMDFVVLGSTPEEMIEKGYEQVGNQFPVFLHPITRDEYALARKDKKISGGYNGFQFDFSPTVTLKEDALRRDFTINSMALPIIFQPINRINWVKEQVIDYFGGLEDLKNGILRHVNADAFSDDPVRVLRGARFAARYNFTIHESTFKLMQKCVNQEFEYLTAERLWKEFEKGLQEPYFVKMLDILNKLGVFDKVINNNKFPISYNFSISEKLNLLDNNLQNINLLRFCVISQKFTKELYEKWKIPNEFSNISLIWNNLEWSKLEQYNPLQVLELIDRSGVVKNEKNKELIFKLFETTNISKLVIDKFNIHLEKISQINNKEIIGNETSGLVIKDKLMKEKLRILSNM